MLQVGHYYAQVSWQVKFCALQQSLESIGVGTVEQLKMLQAEGCDALQGYLFSKPKPLAEVPAIIEMYSSAKNRNDHARDRQATTPRLSLVSGQP